MILNTYAVLLAFVGLLRLPLGLVALAVGAAGWRAARRPVTPGGRTALEDRGYLVFLLTLVLLGLDLLSWPLLYLLLQSYVPQWRGVMCIYGVTQIGRGTLGASRFLPGLLEFLQLSKPALVFLGGAWFVLYLLNRRTRTAPLLGRLFVLLLPLGALAAADAAAELAYVAIPKKEVRVAGGCCTGDTEAGPGLEITPPALAGDAGRPRLIAAYYGINLGLALVLLAAGVRGRGLPSPLALGLLLLGGLAAAAASGLFLIEVAAPTLLHLPYHHCPYDLVGQAPEAVVAVAVYVAGFFLLGWACVARWLGHRGETEPYLGRMVRGLLRGGVVALLASVAMLALELALA